MCMWVTWKVQVPVCRAVIKISIQMRDGIQGVPLKLWAEPFLAPFLDCPAGQAVPVALERCCMSVRKHWEEQAPAPHLEIPARSDSWQSLGAIREAETGLENKTCLLGLPYSLFLYPGRHTYQAPGFTESPTCTPQPIWLQQVAR
jgi:hypothetical protein